MILAVLAIVLATGKDEKLEASQQASKLCVCPQCKFDASRPVTGSFDSATDTLVFDFCCANCGYIYSRDLTESEFKKLNKALVDRGTSVKDCLEVARRPHSDTIERFVDFLDDVDPRDFEKKD